MTEKEQREWVDLLGPTRHAQIKMLRHLLYHKLTDGMSGADMKICWRQLQRLQRLQGVLSS